MKGKGENERYIYLNAEFQRIATRGKKAFFSDQCKEIIENHKMGRTHTTKRLPFHFSLSCIGEGNGNPVHCSCLENSRDGEPYDYTVEVTNRVKGLDLIECLKNYGQGFVTLYRR